MANLQVERGALPIHVENISYIPKAEMDRLANQLNRSSFQIYNACNGISYNMKKYNSAIRGADDAIVKAAKAGSQNVSDGDLGAALVDLTMNFTASNEFIPHLQEHREGKALSTAQKRELLEGLLESQGREEFREAFRQVTGSEAREYLYNEVSGAWFGNYAAYQEGTHAFYGMNTKYAAEDIYNSLRGCLEDNHAGLDFWLNKTRESGAHQALEKQFEAQHSETMVAYIHSHHWEYRGRLREIAEAYYGDDKGTKAGIEFYHEAYNTAVTWNGDNIDLLANWCSDREHLAQIILDTAEWDPNGKTDEEKIKNPEAVVAMMRVFNDFFAANYYDKTGSGTKVEVDFFSAVSGELDTDTPLGLRCFNICALSKTIVENKLKAGSPPQGNISDLALPKAPPSAEQTTDQTTTRERVRNAFTGQFE